MSGLVEKLAARFENRLTYRELQQRRNKVWNEIKSEWDAFKGSQRILHGIEINDNPWDMVIFYLIKKGIL